MDDDRLVDGCIRGEAPAWEALLRRHLRAIRTAAETTLRRATGGAPADEVEEVCQKVVVSLFADGCRRLRSFRSESTLSTWLMVLTSRCALNHVRSCARKGARRFLKKEEPVPPAAESGLGRLLARLRPRDRAVLTMHYAEEMSRSEIAEVLGVRPNTIPSLVQRARRRARETADPTA
ncbi:MAG: RNA polymerase sigma factor [Planctomycetota bacterium]|jgi:RNA polymerase sigma-70 factor (ECF subfamily)